MGGTPQTTQQTSTNQTSTYAPNPQALSYYDAAMAKASMAGNLPYTAFSGELVAPVNAQQLAGVNNINQFAQAAQPDIAQALGYATNAGQYLTPQQINQYYNPYQQQVIQATQGVFNQQNAEALNQITGNTAASGALGGTGEDRAKALLMQGILPGQEQQIAGLESQGFAQALGAAQQQQQNQANAAYNFYTLGMGAQSAGLQGAGAQVGAGTLEQQTQQQLDAALMQQFYQAQAFPYAQSQFLTGTAGSLGPLYGGTTTGQGTGYQVTTQPPPNPFAQILGGVATGVGLFGQGFANPNSANSILPWAKGGGVKGFDMGGAPSYISGLGSPYGGVPYLQPPQFQRGQLIQPQVTPVTFSPVPQQQNPLAGLGSLSGLFKSDKGTTKPKQAAPGYYGGSPETNPNLMPEGGIEEGGDALADLELRADERAAEADEARGGRIRGFDDGGDVDYDPTTSGGFGNVYADVDPLAGIARGRSGVGGEAAPIGLDTMRGDDTPPPALDQSRDRFVNELENPAVSNRFKRLIETEVGGQGPAHTQAFVESVMNRANSRRQTLWQAMNDRAYYPGVSIAGRTPTEPGMYDNAIEAGLRGSNISNYATGNASGNVGFAGGPQTYAIGHGDRFGTEGPDMPWVKAMRAAQQDPSLYSAQALADTQDEGGVDASRDADVPPETTGQPRARSQGVAQSLQKADIWGKLLDFGANTLASTSPYFGVAIGQGLKGAAAAGLSNKKIQAEADKLQKEAEYHRDLITAAQSRHEDTMAIAKQRLQQGTFDIIRAPNGDILGKLNKRNGEFTTWKDMQGQGTPAPATAPKPPPTQTVPPPGPSAPGTTPAPDTAPAPPPPLAPGATPYNPPSPDQIARAAGEATPYTDWLTKYANVGYDYANSKDFPEIPKGGAIPKPAGYSNQSKTGYTADSVENEARNYLLTHKLPPRGGKTDTDQRRFYDAVRNYGNALARSLGMSPEDVAQKWATRPELMKWLTKPTGGISAANYGSSYRHLELARIVADAWYENHGNIPSQTMGRIRAAFAKEFGNAQLTTSDSIADFVGGEVMKGIVGTGQSTGGERVESSDQYKPSSGQTREQFMERINANEAALGEALTSRENMAVGQLHMDPEDFHALVGKDEYKGMKKALESIHNKGNAYPKPTPEQIKEVLDNPRHAESFKEHFGFFPESPKAYQ
jgi:hypothetical protein